MSFTNTSPLVTVTRGKEPFFGTNPISLSAPAKDGENFVLDMATSVVALGKVEIASSSPEFGEAKEVLMVDYADAPVTICFNAQYVLDFIAVVETDSVGLEFKDEMSQAVMKPVGGEGYDYTYVIMPMRV